MESLKRPVANLYTPNVHTGETQLNRALSALADTNMSDT